MSGREAIVEATIPSSRGAVTASRVRYEVLGMSFLMAFVMYMERDIGGEFSGSVSSVMNTWGNLGGAISAVAVGYLATQFGWTSPFLLACGLCLLSAWLVSSIDPRHSAVEESLGNIG